MSVNDQSPVFTRISFFILHSFVVHQSLSFDCCLRKLAKYSNSFAQFVSYKSLRNVSDTAKANNLPKKRRKRKLKSKQFTRKKSQSLALKFAINIDISSMIYWMLGCKMDHVSFLQFNAKNKIRREIS